MCCCSQLGADNLRRENLTRGVHVTGDVMYDLFLRMRPRFQPEEACRRLGVEAGRFVIATLHRDYNVDKPESLRGCLEGLARRPALPCRCPCIHVPAKTWRRAAVPPTA